MTAQYCAMCPYFNAESYRCESTEKRRKIKYIHKCPQRALHKEVYNYEAAKEADQTAEDSAVERGA